MKKILLTLLLLTPIITYAQTTIPFPGFFSEITNVTSQGGGLYDVTISVNDQSGEYNGNAIDTVNYVLWQNCGRYELDSILLQFPSQLIVRVNDVDGSGAPINGFSTVLEESPNLGIGFFISGILDSRNQCMLSYYVERMDVTPSDGGSKIFYKSLGLGDDYTLPYDTLLEYDFIYIEANPTVESTVDIVLPDIPNTDTAHLGKIIKIHSLAQNAAYATTIVSSASGSDLIKMNCDDIGQTIGADTVVTALNDTEILTYITFKNDDYYRHCDYLIDANGNIIANGDTVQGTYNELYFGETLLNDGDTIPFLDCSSERFVSPFSFNDRVVVSQISLDTFEQLNVYVNGVYYNNSVYTISADSLIFSSYTIDSADEIFIEVCKGSTASPNTLNLNQVLSNGNNGGGLLIKNIGDPVDGQDAVTLSYLESFQDSVYRYSSSNGSTSAQIAANGAGITITENSGSGEVIINIPEGVEPHYINLFMPASVTDGGAYHIVLDYVGDRGYNATKNDLNIPLIRTGLDNYSSASRSNPANISENGGNSANTVTYGVSAFGGGDGSDLTMSLINFSLGINQMCRLDFNAIK